MPLDSLIVESLKRQAEIDALVEADIDKAFGQLTLEAILANPAGELQIFSEELAQLIIDRHATKYIAEGVRFANEVKGSDDKLSFNENPEDNPSKDGIDVPDNGVS